MFALFYQEVLLDDELTDLAFEPGFLPFLGLQLLGTFALALEDLTETFLQLLLPLADLCRRDVIFPGDLGGSLFPLDRFQGYPSFELGRQMSSLSFHSSVVWVAPPTASILHLAFGSEKRGHFIWTWLVVLFLSR